MKHRIRIGATMKYQTDITAIMTAVARKANLITGRFLHEQCGHDESPPPPCTVVDSVAFTHPSP